MLGKWNALASQYESQLQGFSDLDLTTLKSCADKLSEAKSYQLVASLSASEANILARTIELLPDAKIGSIHGAWTLKSFS
jgi:hypothetical protein